MEQARETQAQAAAPAAVPARAVAAPGAAQALPALIGNRAFARMAQRRVLARETDTRLGYRDAGEIDSPGQSSLALPWTDPKKPLDGWDAHTILNHLVQVDDNDFTTTDQNRCAANCATAIAILHGPKAVMKLAGAASRRAGNVKLPKLGANPTATQQTRFDDAAHRMLSGVAANTAAMAIEWGVANYGTLDIVADAVKNNFTSDRLGYSYATEAASMCSAFGSTAWMMYLSASREEFEKKVNKLKAGDAFVLLVDTDDLPDDTPRALSQVNHFVVVGKLPGSGERFMYDPWPRSGSQLITGDGDDFWALLEDDDGRWKAVYWTCKVTYPKSKK